MFWTTEGGSLCYPLRLQHIDGGKAVRITKPSGAGQRIGSRPAGESSRRSTGVRQLIPSAVPWDPRTVSDPQIGVNEFPDEVQTSTDAVTLRIIPTTGLSSEFAATLRRELASFLGPDVKVAVEPVDQIPPSSRESV